MKGATRQFAADVTFTMISIHAPMKGATAVRPHRLTYRSHFNPRTHEGCDIEAVVAAGEDHISIHAPMKGATSRNHSGPIRCGISIHAPMKGATLSSDLQ